MARTRKRRRFEHADTAPRIWEMMFGYETARRSGSWVVMVCPDAKVFADCLGAFSSMVSVAKAFSGRTAIFAGGGRLSLTVVKQDPFVPESDPFVVQFLGWDGVPSDVDTGVVKWRERAEKVIKVSA